MRRLINAAQTHPLIRAQAARAIEACPKGHALCQCQSILAWVRRHVRYVPDPADVEALHDPVLMATALHQGRSVYGDCDDFSMYMAALLKAVGHRPAFRVVGPDQDFSHISLLCHGVELDGTRDPWDYRNMQMSRVAIVPI